MAMSCYLQLSLQLGISRIHGRNQDVKKKGQLCGFRDNVSSISLRQYSWSSNVSKRIRRRVCTIPCKNRQFRCGCFLNSGSPLDAVRVKNATLTLARSFNQWQGSPIVIKLAAAVGIVIFGIWGLGPLVRQSRNIFLHESDSSWKQSSTYQVTTSYIQPLLLWTGAIFVCRALDPVILPSEAGQIVKERLLNFIKSLSTVMAFAYCLSSVIQQTQNFFMETNNPTDARSMGFQFAGRAVYTAVWVAAVSLFMELLGFSTQKWLTAGGLGTVLLTLAGREIFTNFLSSAMIHATRPFVVSNWIQTKIEGYDISGTVEHVGWWSQTVVRGDDREAVHIPNHKFTVNVVRNLSQKTHWRIKTHLAISHLDVSKINIIVADMRKVLAKNPQIEQQKLHRRVFLDNINPENQALLILVSCFVKTSHFEEYLCVKEAILLDLLRVIRHHRARLATPIRTVQKTFVDADLDNIPFSESAYSRGAANRPLLLIEPSYKINGEDKTKTQARSVPINGAEDGKPTTKTEPDVNMDSKGESIPSSDTKMREIKSTDIKTKGPASLVEADAEVETKEDSKVAAKSSDPNLKNSTKSDSKTKGPTSLVEADAEVETKEDPKVDAKSSDPKLYSSTKSDSKTDTMSVEETTTNAEAPSVPLPGMGGKRVDNVSSTSQSKQEDGRQPFTTKPSLEENIVLGVALEGSKRTLPIEEDEVPPKNLENVKELAATAKEKNDVKRQRHSGSQGVDQLEKQD